MPETAPENERGLTEEQEKILSEVFLFDEAGDLSEKDVETLAAMFDTPTKFVLLRRALQVLTPAERGLTIKDSKAFVETQPHDYEKFAFDMAVDMRADEKVRQSLVSLYRKVGKHFVEKKRAEFEQQNKEAFEEGQRTEAYNEEKAEEERTLPERV